MTCPNCGSVNIVKNGTIHNGKPKFSCKNCCRQFVINPQNKIIPQETWDLVDKLLLERISIAGISRVTGISETWLQKYINSKYESILTEVVVNYISGSLIVQCDEMWSFVQSKENKQWIWLAINSESKQIVGAYIGKRDRDGAQQLWDSMPYFYRMSAKFYTDFWISYEEVIPSEQHFPVGKETGKTNHIERLNLTFRQRISRLVRETLSFSKKIVNHIGAVWNFIHHYNSEIAPKLAKITGT